MLCFESATRPFSSSLRSVLLASETGRSGHLSELWFWSGILLGILLVGMVAIVFARRYLHSEGNDTEGFDLESLRMLHREGKMSDSEFEAAKAAIIGTLRGGQKKPAKSENRTRIGPSDASAKDSDAEDERPNERPG